MSDLKSLSHLQVQLSISVSSKGICPACLEEAGSSKPESMRPLGQRRAESRSLSVRESPGEPCQVHSVPETRAPYARPVDLGVLPRLVIDESVQESLPQSSMQLRQHITQKWSSLPHFPPAPPPTALLPPPAVPIRGRGRGIRNTIPHWLASKPYKAGFPLPPHIPKQTSLEHATALQYSLQTIDGVPVDYALVRAVTVAVEAISAPRKPPTPVRPARPGRCQGMCATKGFKDGKTQHCFGQCNRVEGHEEQCNCLGRDDDGDCGKGKWSDTLSNQVMTALLDTSTEKELATRVIETAIRHKEVDINLKLIDASVNKLVSEFTFEASVWQLLHADLIAAVQQADAPKCYQQCQYPLATYPRPTRCQSICLLNRNHQSQCCCFGSQHNWLFSPPTQQPSHLAVTHPKRNDAKSNQYELRAATHATDGLPKPDGATRTILALATVPKGAMAPPTLLSSLEQCFRKYAVTTEAMGRVNRVLMLNQLMLVTRIAEEQGVTEEVDPYLALVYEDLKRRSWASSAERSDRSLDLVQRSAMNDDSTLLVAKQILVQVLSAAGVLTQGGAAQSITQRQTEAASELTARAESTSIALASQQQSIKSCKRSFKSQGIWKLQRRKDRPNVLLLRRSWDCASARFMAKATHAERKAILVQLSTQRTSVSVTAWLTICKEKLEHKVSGV
jgi:hypothetical protein